MSEVIKYADMFMSMSLDYKMGGITEETYLQNLAFATKKLGAVVYDSEADTLKHIKRVSDLLTNASNELIRRANCHDDSKLKSPEKELFDEFTPKLKGCTYGSEEYHQYLKSLKIALDHHYANNSHHPEHYKNGVNGFDLFDLIEMFFDWKAATERHADGNIYKSIDINRERFRINEQICDIFKNTATRLGWK